MATGISSWRLYGQLGFIFPAMYTCNSKIISPLSFLASRAACRASRFIALLRILASAMRYQETQTNTVLCRVYSNNIVFRNSMINTTKTLHEITDPASLEKSLVNCYKWITWYSNLQELMSPIWPCCTLMQADKKITILQCQHYSLQQLSSLKAMPANDKYVNFINTSFSFRHLNCFQSSFTLNFF